MYVKSRAASEAAEGGRRSRGAMEADGGRILAEAAATSLTADEGGGSQATLCWQQCDQLLLTGSRRR